MAVKRIGGASLILLSVLLVFSLISYTEEDWPQSSTSVVSNLCGRFGAYFAHRAFFFFGQASWFWPAAVFAWGLGLVRGESWPEGRRAQTGLSAMLVMCSASGVLHQMWPVSGGPGGMLGQYVNVRLTYIFGQSSILLFLFCGLLGLGGLLPLSVLGYLRDKASVLFQRSPRFLQVLYGRYQAWRSRRGPIPVTSTAPAVNPRVEVTVFSPVPQSPMAVGDSSATAVPFIQQKSIPFPVTVSPASSSSSVVPVSKPSAGSGPRESEVLSPEESEFQKGLARYRLPPLELLKWPPEQDGGHDQKQLQHMGQILEDTLKNFGINAQVVQIVPGPTVTLYEVLPAAGVPVSKIAAREADVKLALAANSIRIVAPIPGKSVVGVEVPNPKAQVVKIRELLALEKFSPGSYRLPFVLGKDILGKPVMGDLQKMPHVLIAGATGSGKSVCVSSLLITLLYQMTPEQLRLILIDPKRVELSMFTDVPHLLAPPILDAKGSTRAFKWLLVEMDSRYNILTDSGTKSLEGYNDEQKKLGLPIMPYIVLVVDELADLMLSAPKETEGSITRLAQMSRAVGIHLVLATQRPSVDVITGLIKANMPARIAFQVASQFDSRTILDGKGAESLLGRGDMLYLPPGAPKPIRLQGALVDEEEIRRVVDYVRGQMKPRYVDLDSVPENLMLQVDGITSKAIADSVEEIDAQLYEDAKRFIIEIRKGSTSMLQRKFRIGFNRATKIIDMLERDGVVGPNKGPTPRDVLVTVPPQDEEDRG